MNRKVVHGIVVLVIIVGFINFAAERYSIAPVVGETGADFLNVPEGFSIKVFADDLGSGLVSVPGPNAGPRMMAEMTDGVLVSVTGAGAIIRLYDKDRDGIVEDKQVFIEGLHRPHGIAIIGDWVYIAEEARISRVRIAVDGRADRATHETVFDLPAGGHFTRTIHIFKNKKGEDKLYITIGSSCNVCIEEDPRRAAMVECDIVGARCRVFARGLRNTVDFTMKGGHIYGTDNGRDGLGNDIPPDEINIIREGAHYGWPNCYGKNIHDTDFDKNIYIRNPCMEPFETPASVELPAHVAPLGLAFYEGETFPAEYRDKLFVAYHGSWDANPSVGYKVAAVDMTTGAQSDFITGWRTADGAVHGRPVGILNYAGGLLVSDDTGGKIYFVSYGGAKNAVK